MFVRQFESLNKSLDGVELFDGYHYDENGVVVLKKGDTVTGFCHPEHFKKIAEPYSGDAGDETA